jgi:small subunit ribosomal protein S4
MARVNGPVWKKARRLGFSILETGEELKKRQSVPGQHGGKRPSKLSNYGLQLREKQRIRFMYGVTERQFYNTYLKAVKMAGVTGHNFLSVIGSPFRQRGLPYGLRSYPQRSPPIG